MPPGPQQYTLPRESIFIPSGAPLPSPVVSAQTLPPASVPSPFTSKTRMCWRAVSLTKSRRPSSEKQSPLGRSKSSATRIGLLASGPTQNTPWNGSSCGRATP